MRFTKLPAVVLMLVLMLAAASALTVSTSPTSITETLSQGQTKNVSLLYTISNTDNSSQSAILNLGNFPSGFLNSNSSNIVVPANSQVSGTINIALTTSASTQPNTYTGSIFLSSQQIPVSLTVTQGQASQTGVCKIYTLPIPLSKSLEAGSTDAQSIDVYVSKYCSTALRITTNQPVQQKPIKFDAVSGSVEPSEKFTIQLKYDTRDVARGTYTDNIIISGIDDNENQYSLQIPLSVTVTNSISPVTNGTFSTLPSCSLSSSSFSINQTYKLTCTNIDANIDVQTAVDPSFIVGVAPYVEETTTTYSYFFTPIKFGDTTFKANFLFKGAQIGTGFSQVISIGGTPATSTGSKLVAKFYPELYESKDGNVIVRILNNQTGDVYDDALIYLDGALVNNSLHLSSNKEYELRATKAGFLPIVQKISITPKIINFSLNSQYVLGDILNFETNPANATILYDNQFVTFPLVLDEEGAHTISASFLGYTTTTKNITVAKTSRILVSTPTEDAKVGKVLNVTVDRNDSNLRIVYREDSSAAQQVLNQTIGSSISAEIEKKGLYDVYADNFPIKSYTVEGKSIFASWWFWVIIVILVVSLVIWMMRSSSQPTSPSGMSFNLGDNQ